MARILQIDTATAVCSVALAIDGTVVGIKENNEGLNHSLLLGTFIDDLLKEQHTDMSGVDAVAVSMGPGSYTGLRIGVSMAKGLCFGAGKPLLAVSTLQALAYSVSAGLQEDILYCPMLDARRMEVYTALFDRDNRPVGDTKALVITPESFADILAERPICFFGDGSGKTRQHITSPNARFIEGVESSAAFMTQIAAQKYENRQFEDVAYFEPFYLKDFVATVPKHQIIPPAIHFSQTNA